MSSSGKLIIKLYVDTVFCTVYVKSNVCVPLLVTLQGNRVSNRIQPFGRSAQSTPR